MPIRTLFIDLDDTVYPASLGLWIEIRTRIDLYMHDRLGIPWEGLTEMRQNLFNIYGTSMRGLQQVYQIDQHEFLAFVHDVPLSRYLKPDPMLRAALLCLPQRKIIFTNADRNHARRVLAALDLSDCFDQIIDIIDLDPYCKPMPAAFEIALQLSGETDPRTCLLVDDQPRNIAAARKFGMPGMCINGLVTSAADCDACLPTLADLPLALASFDVFSSEDPYEN